MPYLNTDDNFCDHPKVDGLSDAAFRLHVAGMHHCAKHLTDGFVDSARISRLKRDYRPSQLNELLRAGVWHKAGEGCGTDECPIGEAGGYVVHDYLQWNKPRSWWEKKRADDAERKRQWREQRALQNGRSEHAESQ